MYIVRVCMYKLYFHGWKVYSGVNQRLGTWGSAAEMQC